ncbi:MAG: PHP domain-containing protein, partial [bacterium]|nr:PHP domain-containing protein [bacterium]
MDKYVDLHMHSTCSDGTFTPEEVVRRAAELGLVAIGLTDHDSVEGVSTAQAVGREVGVDVVPGTELSAQFDEKDIHILAYFIDPEDPDLANCLTQFREARLRRAEEMVRKLNQMGIRVRMEQVLAKAEGAAIGRPHV